MTAEPHRRVEHEITVSAEADAVYGLIADVRHWSEIFPPTVHAERIDADGATERIRIWATANGEAKTWTSRRVLDPGARRVEFRQEVSAAPVAAMGGAWVLEPHGAGATRVRLLHDYRAVDDDPEKLSWIDAAVDRNSRSELAALKTSVESADGRHQVLRIADSVQVDGSVKDVYDFVNEAGLWSERLPHVARVDLTEPAPGLQILEMDTRTKDGAPHTTRSVRVCFPDERIVYKQTILPALMSMHTGRWEFTPADHGVTATSHHTVRVNTDNIAAVLGPGKDVEDARQVIRAALSANSGATLRHAKEYAEGRR